MENTIYKLCKPIAFDGQDLTELNLDLDNLSANDLEICEKEARLRLSKREMLTVPALNTKYLACVAAKAAGVKSSAIFSLKAKDFTLITTKVQNFLLDGDSEEEIETEIEPLG